METVYKYHFAKPCFKHKVVLSTSFHTTISPAVSAAVGVGAVSIRVTVLDDRVNVEMTSLETFVSSTCPPTSLSFLAPGVVNSKPAP